jgi:hypothetical protein
MMVQVGWGPQRKLNGRSAFGLHRGEAGFTVDLFVVPKCKDGCAFACEWDIPTGPLVNCLLIDLCAGLQMTRSKYFQNMITRQTAPVNCNSMVRFQKSVRGECVRVCILC